MKKYQDDRYLGYYSIFLDINVSKELTASMFRAEV
jgi:hypothetical protein